MTKPKDPDNLQSPNRVTGEVLRRKLGCPLCKSPNLRVDRYHGSTTRMECPACGLLFSINLQSLVNALSSKAETLGMLALGVLDREAAHTPDDAPNPARKQAAAREDEKRARYVARRAIAGLWRPGKWPDPKAVRNLLLEMDVPGISRELAQLATLHVDEELRRAKAEAGAEGVRSASDQSL